MDEIDICWARLGSEEGRKPWAYNDKTGKKVTCLPEGNLSIGIGINLETGLDAVEMEWLTRRRLGLVAAELKSYLWYNTPTATANRKSVFLDLGFNNGVRGLLHYPDMLAAAGKENWINVANELLNSKAARDLPTRYEPLALIMRRG